MKATVIGPFIKMATKPINGFMFSAWRTPDNKHFYLAPVTFNPNAPTPGKKVEHYEISPVLLGNLNMMQ